MVHPGHAVRVTLRAALLAATGLASTALPGQAQTAPASTPPGASTDLPALSIEAKPDLASTETPGYVAKRETTATKTDTPIIEVPQSISVVTRDQLNQQDAETLDEALRYTSGVVTGQRGGDANRYDILTIRGFDANYYLNGLRQIGNNFYLVPQVDPYLLERIEVLKGPASILYGSASAGGLINQESRLPQPVAGGEVGLEFGNYNHRQLTFDSTGPIDKDGKWSYRITGIGRDEDSNVLYNKNQRIAVAPALTYRPDGDTRFTLLGMYQYDPRVGPYGSVPPQGSALPNPNGAINRDFYDGNFGFEKFRRTQAAFGYQFEKRFNDTVSLYSTARWYHIEQDYASVYANGLESDLRTLDRGTAASTGASDAYTLDTHAQFNVATGPFKHVILAGVDYQHLSSHENAGFNYLTGTTPTLDIYAPNYYQQVNQPSRYKTDVNFNQYGVYLQDQIRWRHVLLTGSLRGDLSDQQTRSANFGTQQNQYDTAVTGRAGITYLFDNGIAPYASYTEGFNPTVGTNLYGQQFKPERDHQYEVGVKYSPPGLTSLFTAALFDLTRNNLLTADPSGIPGLSVQSGQARSRGAELEAKVSVNDQFNVILNYTYTDTVYTKDSSGLQGQRLPTVPLHSASGWGIYTFPDGPAKGLSLGAGARYTGTTFAYNDAFRVHDYVLVDSTIRYDLGERFPAVKGASLYVNAKNLLDEKYVASCFYTNWCAFGYGRQVFGGVKYRW